MTLGNEETVSSIEAEIFDEEIEELQNQQERDKIILKKAEKTVDFRLEEQ